MDPLKRLDLSRDDERNQQFEKLILTTIKNYFRLPWLNLTEKETSIVDRFVNENLHRTNKTEQRQRQQSQRSQSSKTTCLLIELDKDNVDVSSVSKNYINLEVGVGNEGSKDNDDNQANNVGLRFQIVPVEKLKSLRPSQKRSNNYRQHHRISPNQADRHQKSIIFVPIVPSGSILASYLNHGEDGMKNLDRNQTVRLITDDEAIKLLADILNQSTSSNDDITLALKQLERFLDREHVIKKIWNERREFLRKLSQWTENLLEIDSDENEDNDGDDYNRNDLNFNRINQNKLIDSSKQSDSGNDSNVNSENDEDDKNEDDGGVDSKQNEKNQLEKLSRKIIILKQRNKLLDEIVTNFAILFHDVPNYEQNRDELVETSKLLASELNQLFHRWKVSVSNELQQDLTKRCIIIDEDSSVPIITFSLNLERYVDLAKQFEEIGIEIPNEIKQIETRFAKYFGIVRDLQKIVLFYMTVAEKILPSQRSLLLDKAQAFTSLLESQQKLTWSDPIATIEQWVDRLKRFMNEFNEENSLLQQSHRRILEIIKWTVEESIDQWPKMINQIKLILSSSLNRPEIDTYTWRKHWDYQLYKILEYNFTHLFRDRNPTRISVSMENSEWNSQFELFLSPQSIRVNLKFDSNGLVIYEPSIEILKQNLFEQYQTIVRFPSRLKAFVDWSLDAELNPIDSSSSSMVTHTLFHNIYFRNAKNFSQIYQRLFDAWNELIEIRSRFLQWSALYALVREIQSIAIGSDLNDDRNDGENGDSQEREDVKKRFHFETLDDYQYNLNLIQKFHQEFSQNYSMINEIQCRHSSYLINIIPIKMFAEWLRNEIDLVLLRNLQTRCLQEMRSLEEDCGKFRDSIHKIPSTIDELIEIDALVEKKLNDFCSEKQLAMIKVREKMQFLENWSASMTSLKSNELAERFDRIKTIQNELNTIRENRNEILERQSDILRSKFQLDLSQTEENVMNFIERWNNLSSQIKQSPEIINDFHINSTKLIEKVVEQKRGCGYFGIIPPQCFQSIEILYEEIVSLFNRYHVLYEFERSISIYRDMEWIICRNKLPKISETIDEWLESNLKQVKPNDDNHQDDGDGEEEHVHLQHYSYIERWRTFLKQIEICRGDFYQQFHWQQLMVNVLKIFDKNFEDLKLSDLWLHQDKLEENRSQLIELNKRAFNDHSLREAFNELNQFALNGKFQLYLYESKDSKQIWLIKEWNQCYNQISDCFLLLQTIKNIDQNEISDEYLRIYQEWEIKIVRFDSLVTLLNSIQRKWIALEPIYQSSSSSSSTMMSSIIDDQQSPFFQDPLFNRYSNDFQDVMRTIKQNEARYSFLIGCNQWENRLKLIDQNLNQTQRKLRNFMEESRRKFPRFYFLSDEDLLLILSGKVDLNRSALIRKLFINTIGRLIYSNDNDHDDGADEFKNKKSDPMKSLKQISAIESIQGETITLDRPITIDNNHGPERIEIWLNELDQEIKSTLRNLFTRYLSRKRNIFDDIELFTMLPSQILSLYSFLDFTEKIENSLGGISSPTSISSALKTLKTFYGNFLQTLTKDRQKFLNQMLESIASSSRIKLNRKDQIKVRENLCKIKIKQIVLDLIHFLTIIDRLIDENVTDPNHWCWQSQLRFYCERNEKSIESKLIDSRIDNDRIEIRMGLASFNYSFEYLGSLGDSKLVYTDLTNKCFLTLTQAMNLGLGGNPYGPAGTGKTESVKALGQFFGRQVLVFNCDEAIDVRSMTRILIGLLKCGNWGCFDEFNRLEVDVLSILSSKIQEIQNCIRSRTNTLYFEDYGEVLINNNAAIFITMNPTGKHYGGRNRIPDNLKSLFLPVAMTVPDNSAIVRFLSLAEGFSNKISEILGNKVPFWFEFANGSMSQQRHYDWGLRTIKACLESSGRRLNSIRSSIEGDYSNRLELDLFVDTLRQQIKSKLVDSDASKFDGLVEVVFGGSDHFDEKKVRQIDQRENLIESIRKVFDEHNLISNEYQFEKIQLLYEQIQTRFGVVLIGQSGTGKTTIWKMLRNALIQSNKSTNNTDSVADLHRKQKQRSKLIDVTVINPNSMSKSKLFGYVDEDTREWNDGLFSLKSREISRDDDSDDTDSNIGSMHWIVFDGNIDPDWVETLNSVLDDNRVLTLPSGERIDFDPAHCRILFETTSLRNASPATISRLGVLSVDKLMTNEMIQSFVARNRLPFSSFETIQNYLEANRQRITMSFSTTRSLLRHLRFSQEMNEDESMALDRMSGRLSDRHHHHHLPQHSQSKEPILINDRLVVTESINRYVEMLKPFTNEHIGLIGPIGSGKTILAQEILFSTLKGHLICFDCTSRTDAESFLKRLFSTTMIVNTGSNRTLQSNSGRPLWVFIRHLEILTLDKWSSNSLISLLILMLKHHGFHHPQTFEWIHFDRNNRIILTSTNIQRIDQRLLNELHLVQFTRYNHFEVEQILMAKTKKNNPSLCKYFPQNLLRIINDQLESDKSTLLNGIEQINLLKLGIEILDALRHYDQFDEKIVDYEINRSISNLESLQSKSILTSQSAFSIEENNHRLDGIQSRIYTSLDGQFSYDQIDSERFRKQIAKWIQQYSIDNDHHHQQHLSLQSIRLSADLCSFLASNTERSDRKSTATETLAIDDYSASVPTMMIVGPNGFGRKFLVKSIAYNFGYEKIWSPDFITSERHLIGELNALLHSEDDQSSSSGGRKILILIDEIHFELLEYLRDIIYDEMNRFRSTSNNVIRLILTTTTIEPIDELIWLRNAKIHRIPAFNQKDLNELARNYLQNYLSNDDFVRIETIVEKFYPIFEHFASKSNQDLEDEFDQSRSSENFASFKDFLQTFVILFERKVNQTFKENERIKIGVMKLDSVSNQVVGLKNDAIQQKQLLNSKRQEADDAFNLIMNSMHQSEDKKVELEDVQQKTKIETDNLKERKAKIDEELSAIEPVLEKAKAAIGGIRSDSLTEIRSLRAPPEVIRDILEGVLRLMGVNDTSWVSMKNFLSRRGVKEEIMNFDCHRITPEIRLKVEQLLQKRNESFQMNTAKRASAAAAPLAEWVKANVEYSRVLHKIEPLEIELRKLEANLSRAQSHIRALDSQLKDVDTEVGLLRERMQAITVEAAEIEINLKNSTKILQQSESIVNDLGAEHRRWTEQLEKIESEQSLMPLRCLISSAYVSQACQESSFSKRNELLSECFEKFQTKSFEMNEFLQTESEEESLLFGNRVDVHRFANQNDQQQARVFFPQRISLICDPTRKVLNNFPKAELTTFESKDWIKILELGIRFGRTIIITNFQRFDVRVIPLLSGEIYGSTSSNRFWTFIGEKKIDYNPNFALYLMTDSLRSITARTLSMLRSVNLSPSFSSLSSRLLGKLIQINRPELETKKIELDLKVRESQEQLKNLENELLEILSEEERDLLNDEPLILKLKSLKKSSETISQSLLNHNQLKIDLEKERSIYKSMANFASNLFLVANDLSRLNPMYHFGYGEFQKLFHQLSIGRKRSKASKSIDSMLVAFDEEDLSLLYYKHIGRALFSEHREAFRKFLHQQHPKHFDLIDGRKENRSKTNIELAQTQTISEFLGEIFEDDDNDVDVADNAKNDATNIDSHQNLVGFSSEQNRLVLIMTTPGSDPINEIKNSVQSFGYDLRIISMGNETCEQVIELLRSSKKISNEQRPSLVKTNYPSRKHPRSDQTNRSQSFSNESKQILCLTNLHLVIGWLNTLSQTLEEIRTASIRIILITEICESFPSTLLEITIKFAYESEPGLREHLKRLRSKHTEIVLHTNQLDSIEIFDETSKSQKTSNRMFSMDLVQNLNRSLELFHAICCERRFYVPFGWTKSYEFSFNEFYFGYNLIQKLLKQSKEGLRNRNNLTQLSQYLDGLFHQIIYGGKIDFILDEIILKQLLRKCFRFDGKNETTSATMIEVNSNDLVVLGLPMNANKFRMATMEKRLMKNLQILSIDSEHRDMDDGVEDVKHQERSKSLRGRKRSENFENEENGGSESKRFLTLNPSGIDYFRKLWSKILSKCRIEQIDDLKEEISLNLSRRYSMDNHVKENNFFETKTIQEFVEEFFRFELNFAKRLLIQIDFELQTLITIDLDNNHSTRNESNVISDSDHHHHNHRQRKGQRNRFEILSNLEQCLRLNQTPDGWQNLWLNGSENAQDFLINLSRIYLKLSQSVSSIFSPSKTAQKLPSFNLSYCFHPKLFLNALKQFSAQRFRTTIDRLCRRFVWDSDKHRELLIEPDSDQIHIDLIGLNLQGAMFQDEHLHDCSLESEFVNWIPKVRIIFSLSSSVVERTETKLHEIQSERFDTVWIPVYSSSSRETLLEQWPLPCQFKTKEKWIEMGIALVLGKFD